MSTQEALDLYLDDHLAGAAAGIELAEKLAADTETTPVGSVFAGLLADIQADRDVLRQLLKALDVEERTLKQAGTWASEKLARLRFASAKRKEAELGLLLQAEALHMGVAGKLSLWQSLQAAAPLNPELAAAAPDLNVLIARAEDQLRRLETERLRAAEAALAAD